jgi:hypothetical protein
VKRPKVFSRFAKALPFERRRFLRFFLPLPLTVTARWNGQAVLLERDPALENISAGGLYFRLLNAPGSMPADAELEVTIPLVESTFRPARVYARCRARVVRRDAPTGIAAEFDEVEFVREERPSGLPVPLPA